MTLRRVWFVLPLDLAMDHNKGEFGPELELEVQEAPMPRNNRGRGLGIGNALEPEPVALAPQPPEGRGFYLDANSKKQFDKAYTTQEFAEAQARLRAEKEPKRPFGVFSCVSVFETTVPTVIEKEFNENGELRLVGK